MQFTILQTQPGRWTWHLWDASGELLAKGVDYLRKQECLDAVLRVKMSTFASVQDRLTDLAAA